MAPTTLFDKSFLQCLSLDESVWFDHFFRPLVSPLFYAETLADLEKAAKPGKSPEAEVQAIARKFPEKQGWPCPHHTELALRNLLGEEIPMDGRIIPGQGSVGRDGSGRAGVVFEERPEAVAFRRWQGGDFQDVERRYAKRWRQSLADTDLKAVAELVAGPLLAQRSCRSEAEAYSFADELVTGLVSPAEAVHAALMFLAAPGPLRRDVLARHKALGFPPLTGFAPYAAFVLRVELFFNIAVKKTLIAPERPSNRIDIAYLFYLPFCQLFFSCDRLHDRTARLFMRPDQKFVEGNHVKRGLAEIDGHYKELPEEVTRQGLYHFASSPPDDRAFLVCGIWDEFLPGWREASRAPKTPRTAEQDKATIAEIDGLWKNARSKSSDQEGEAEPGQYSFQKLVRRKKGSWYQVPYDLPDMSDEEWRDALGEDGSKGTEVGLAGHDSTSGRKI